MSGKNFFLAFQNACHIDTSQVLVEENEQYGRSFGTRTKDSFVSNIGSIVFKHLCKYCIVLDTHRSDMNVWNVT